MITMRQLEALCAVIETGSISVAAERLFLSQPAVSKIIAALEYRTQLTLFDREYRRLVPTAEALFLYDEAQRLLAGFTDITRLAEELRTLNAGSITIASMVALGSALVPGVIGRFLQSRPTTDITFQIRSSNKIMQWAIAQQIDFGLAITAMEHEAVSKEVLCSVPGVCAMNASHRYACKDHIAAQDLHGESFVSFVKEGFMRHTLDEIFSSLHVKPERILTVTNSYAACALVMQTDGVAIVDPYTAMSFVPQGLVFKPFLPQVSYDFQLLWPRYRARSKLAQMLALEIKSAVESYNTKLNEASFPGQLGDC